MGGTASLPNGGDPLQTMIIDATLYEGSMRLSQEIEFRNEFVSFVKGGLWFNKLILTEARNKLLTRSERLRKEKDHIVYEYKGRIQNLQELVGLMMTSKDNMSSGKSSLSSGIVSPRTRSGSFDSNNGDSGRIRSHYEASYTDVEDICSLSNDQLTCMMITILLPIFLKEGYKCVSNVAVDSESSNEDSEDRSDVSDYFAPTFTRMQELLLSSAACCDETALIQGLEDPSWTSNVCHTIENHPLSITICDVSEEGCPIVFANKAMTKLTGYSKTQMVGMGFNMFHGPLTEHTQEVILEGAMRNRTDDKIAVTHYTKRGEAFLNLVATKPIIPRPHTAFIDAGAVAGSHTNSTPTGAIETQRYAVAIHFSHTSGNVKLLESVDDTLIFLSYLVRDSGLAEEQGGASISRRSTNLSIASTSHIGLTTTTTTSTSGFEGCGGETGIKVQVHENPQQEPLKANIANVPGTCGNHCMEVGSDKTASTVV